MANQVYGYITERIMELLEKGVIPWRKPWRVTMPMNYKTKKPYRGINLFLLNAMPYSSPYWLSFKQVQELGGSVKKGEKSTMVIFWKIVVNETAETQEGKKSSEVFPILRYYNVFNVEQCEGLNVPPVETDLIEFITIDNAEAVINNMPNRPEIKHIEQSAFYSPVLDYVNMPNRNTFESEAKYYSTLFHELIHSTGHSSRVNRKLDGKLPPFGSPDYSKEELIAEMGASYLCGYCGIENTTIENSAAYLRSWLKVLKNDKTFVVLAAAAAQKASDFILNYQFDDQYEPAGEVNESAA